MDLNSKSSRLDRMSISDKTKKSLEKIGLTSYEIKSFSALLRSGEIQHQILVKNQVYHIQKSMKY